MHFDLNLAEKLEKNKNENDRRDTKRLTMRVKNMNLFSWPNSLANSTLTSFYYRDHVEASPARNSKLRPEVITWKTAIKVRKKPSLVSASLSKLNNTCFPI